MLKNQKGIAHFGVVLILTLVLAGVGFAGWKVFASNKNKSATTKGADTSAQAVKPEETETPAEVKKPVVPEGYVVYENKEIGFKFAYPKEWGTVARTGDDNSATSTNGLNGRPLRTAFENGDTGVLPRGNRLNGDPGVGTDEGHYGGGYIQKGDRFYSIAKYTSEEVEIPADRILAKVESGMGTVLIINAGTIAGNRIELLANLPAGKPLHGLDLMFKNSNEDFADESKIDASGLETLKTVAQTFESM